MAIAKDLRATLERLWSVPVYLPYLQPALTARAITRAEARLGVRLPAAYFAALRIQNGGYVRLTEHPRGDAPVDCIWGIGPRFPSLLEHDWTDIKECMRDEGITRPRNIDELIPFCGDGHVHYCFDYRRGGRRREPCITYIDVETFDTDRVVASDFGTFVRQLRAPEVIRAVGLVTRAPAAKVAAALSAATRVHFDDQGDQDHGYRVYRAALPRTTWAWLEANSTRRGFVRRSDPEYGRLHTNLREVVDRYPEHADCGYFVRCSDPDSPAARRLVRALVRLPFAARSVRLRH